MAETWNKRERERNKRQKRQQKLEKRQERRHTKGHHDWQEMLAYVDENGNLSSQPAATSLAVTTGQPPVDIRPAGIDQPARRIQLIRRTPDNRPL